MHVSMERMLQREEYLGEHLTHRDNYLQQTGTQAEIGEIKLDQERNTGKMKERDVAGITISDTLNLAANAHPDAKKLSSL